MKTLEKKVYYGNIYDTTDYESEKYIKVNACGMHNSSSSITVRERGRRDWLILYVKSGEFTVMVQNKDIILKEGGFAVYPPNIPHRYYQNTGIAYFIHFSGSAIPDILKDAKLDDDTVFFDATLSAKACSICEKMIYEYALNSAAKDIMLNTYLMDFISELHRNSKKAPANIYAPGLRQVIIEMNKNFRQDITIEKYAKMMGLCKGRFITVFKNSMKVSPYSYVLSLKLNAAQELLLNNEIPISEIAYEVGFKDPLYFSRIFKKKHSVSPREFRLKAQI